MIFTLIFIESKEMLFCNETHENTFFFCELSYYISICCQFLFLISILYDTFFLIYFFKKIICSSTKKINK